MFDVQWRAPRFGWSFINHLINYRCDGTVWQLWIWKRLSMTVHITSRNSITVAGMAVVQHVWKRCRSQPELTTSGAVRKFRCRAAFGGHRGGARGSWECIAWVVVRFCRIAGRNVSGMGMNVLFVRARKMSGASLSSIRDGYLTSV